MSKLTNFVGCLTKSVNFDKEKFKKTQAPSSANKSSGFIGMSILYLVNTKHKILSIISALS